MNSFIYGFILWTLAGFCSEASNPCNLRDYGDEKRVCVCNSTYCDTIDREPTVEKGKYVMFISTKDGLRFNRTINNFENQTKSSYTFLWLTHPYTRQFKVNSSKVYQKIMGYGGAFTDSFGINVLSLEKGAQANLLKSYFSVEGIEYNMGRIPIAGTDFSTHTYSYDDGEADKQLANFALAEEDYKYKIPLILESVKMSSKGINFVAASWSPPTWMKTNKDYSGFSFLKEEFYDSYAKYLIKFIDEYKKNGVPIWGISTGNEPSLGFLPVKHFNSLGWTPQTVAKWTANNFGPLLRNSTHNETKILAFDDQRLFLPWWIKLMVKSDKNLLKYVDGFGIHWYWDFIIGSGVVQDIHELYPEKFILYTEASVGDKFWEEKVDLGSWDRGEKYLSDIIQNTNTWVTGWIDWNMALDLTGGPTWAKNFVDSPILLNASSGEFLKQPMFYALGHVSKFINEGSVRLDISPSESDGVHAMAVKNPSGRIIVVLLNKNKKSVDVSIEISGLGWINKELPPHSMATIICSGK